MDWKCTYGFLKIKSWSGCCSALRRWISRYLWMCLMHVCYFIYRLVIFGGFGPPPENELTVKGEWEGDPSSVRWFEHGMEVRVSACSFIHQAIWKIPLYHSCHAFLGIRMFRLFLLFKFTLFYLFSVCFKFIPV